MGYLMGNDDLAMAQFSVQNIDENFFASSHHSLRRTAAQVYLLPTSLPHSLPQFTIINQAGDHFTEGAVISPYNNQLPVF